MKKNFALLAFSLSIATNGFSQFEDGRLQATLQRGVSANTVKILLRPTASFSGQFSNLQFTLQLPVSMAKQPTVAIKQNPLRTFVPTTAYVTKTSREGGFYNYLFSAVPVGALPYNFLAGVEIETLEVEITGAGSDGAVVRLASLPGGGASGQMNFYAEVNGVDKTHTAAMFYGEKAVNGGGYSKYSHTGLGNATPEEKGFTLVPNPARDRLTLRSPAGFSCESCLLRITDAKGAIVFQRKESFSGGGNKEISIAAFAAGTHFLSLANSETVIFKKSFVKQ